MYADYLDGKVYHYRDKSNLECDAIVVLRDGRWGAIETKMDPKEFDTVIDRIRYNSFTLSPEKRYRISCLPKQKNLFLSERLISTQVSW